MVEDQISHRQRKPLKRGSSKLGFRPGLPADQAAPVKKKPGKRRPAPQQEVVPPADDKKDELDELGSCGSAEAAGDQGEAGTAGKLTPAELEAQWTKYATGLIAMDKKDRDATMRKLKKDDPTGHGIAKDKMAAIRKAAKGK